MKRIVFAKTAALAALLLLSCSSVPAGVRAAGAEISAERVKAALPELDRVVGETLKRTRVPGMSIAVVFKDEVVYLKGFGLREAGGPDPVDADTVFQLASLSKPVASTIVAGVIGDGLATWDDRVVDHDPGFQMYEPWVTTQVTLRDLFAHRSGLPDHAGDELEDIGFDRAAVLYRLRYLKPATSFRSGYAYTNFGITEAAVAAAAAAGKTWENLAAERLYRPLGMTNTSSRYADFVAARNRALGHVLVDGKYVAKYKRDADAQSPAGGVSSTARDMAEWLRLQLGHGKYDGKQVINAAALAETHRPQTISHSPEDPSTDRAGFYGLGWNVGYEADGSVRLGHSGAFALGAATAVTLLPADELGIVVLANATPTGVPEAVIAGFLDLVRTGKVQRDYLPLFKGMFETFLKPTYNTDYSAPPARPAPALAHAAYVGRFTNPYFGQIEIVAEGGGLFLRLGPKRDPFPLRHYDRDVFLYQPVGENAAGPSGVTFTVGSDGGATEVRIENLDTNKQGTFARQ